jgi:flagellar hook-basal body complex protein FliE
VSGAIAAIDSVLASAPVLTQLGTSTPVAPQTAPTVSFSDILTSGMAGVEKKLAAADDLVKRFTLGGNIPVHQVTYALEEAKMSVELAMQVRGRLLDGYRELMNMQL